MQFQRLQGSAVFEAIPEAPVERCFSSKGNGSFTLVGGLLLLLLVLCSCCCWFLFIGAFQAVMRSRGGLGPPQGSGCGLARTMCGGGCFLAHGRPSIYVAPLCWQPLRLALCCCLAHSPVALLAVAPTVLFLLCSFLFCCSASFLLPLQLNGRPEVPPEMACTGMLLPWAALGS